MEDIFSHKDETQRGTGLIKSTEHDPYSLYVFRSDSCFRKGLIKLVNSKTFEYTMIFAIFLNSISLAVYDYKDRQSTSTKNKTIDIINTVCTAIFTLEALIKIIAQGLFYSRVSYLRSGWNIIDAIVVLSGLLELALGKMKLKALRVVRVFRPLKSLTAHKGLKKLVSTLLYSLYDLANVATFLIYIFLLFAILGLHQYNGVQNNLCRYHEQPLNGSWPFDDSIQRVCTQSGLGGYQCPMGMYCGNHDEWQTYDITTDRMRDRSFAFNGVFNFDNIWNSFLTVTMIINSNTWYQHMLNMMDSDIPFMGAIYCFLMIIIGQFFLVNLILAVIIQSFIKIQKQELEFEIAQIANLNEALTQNISQKRQTKRVVIVDSVKVENIEAKTLVNRIGSSKFNGDSIESFQNEPEEESEVLPVLSLDQILPKRKEMEPLVKGEEKANNNESSHGSDIGYKQSFVRDTIKPLSKVQAKQENKMKWNAIKRPAANKKLTIHSKEIREAGDQKAQLIQLTLEERAREFERKLKRNLEEQYREYFKRIIREAQLSYRGPDRDEYINKANLREIVGLRVGLSVINSQRKYEKLYDRQLHIEWRAMQSQLYNRALMLAESGIFAFIISLVIIGNLCVLCLDRYPGDERLSAIIEKWNMAFTFIYALELYINLAAVGVRSYYQGSLSNVFDSVIVCLSIIDIIITLSVGNSKDAGSIFTALRGFRLLRVFKLAKVWKRFGLMLEIMARTLIDVGVFSILIALFIFTFTLLGMELFAHEAKYDARGTLDFEDGTSPKFNFDTFQNALFTVFICLTNDATTEVWISYNRVVDGASTSIYFLMLIFLGQRLLLNIFLAILLQNFDEGALRQKMIEFAEVQQDIRRRIIGVLTIDEKLRLYLKSFFRKLKELICRRKQGQRQSMPVDQVKEDQLKCKEMDYVHTNNISKSITNLIQHDQNLKPVLLGVSLNILNVENQLRVSIYNIIQHPRFDQFINIAIIISAIQLALDDQKVDPNSSKFTALFWIDIQTTLIFALEAMLKILAFGLVQNGQYSYLKRIWNQVDFLIIIFSIISLTPLSDDFSTVKVLRVLRLIRWITKNPGLQTAVKVLILAIPNIFSIFIVFVLFLIVFGVLTVSQFKGLAFQCLHLKFESGHPQSKWGCLNLGGEWVNNAFNFDNSINSLVTLFILSTSSNWGEIVLTFIQSRELNYESDNQAQYLTAWLIFFSVLVTIGYLFFLNLFVGVVISTFNSEHDRLSGVDFLTEQQKEWIQMKLMILKRTGFQREQKPRDPSRRLLYRLQKHIAFDRAFMFLIILNMIVLCIKWYEQPSKVSLATEYINYIFTGCFLVEIMIKIVGLGCREYFSKGWNTFDAIVIFGSFISIFVSANSSISLKGVFTILRSFRVLRLLRLIKRGKSLEIIFNTILITLRAFANIGALLLLVIFIYTIVGMMIFGNIMHSGMMNDWINFETFSSGFLTLFIVATGDQWNSIMQAFSQEHMPYYKCIQSPSYDDYAKVGQFMGCGSSSIAFSYFLSYIVIVNLIFLKIFIAIVLQGYKDTQAQYDMKVDTNISDNSNYTNTILKKQFRYQAIWNEFDPENSSFLPISKLRPFLQTLGPPLGFDPAMLQNSTLQDRFISSLELPTYNGFEFYQYQDIFDSLTLKLMVIERLKKQRLEKEERERLLKEQASDGARTEMDHIVSKEMELKIKAELKLEVNRLFVVQKGGEVGNAWYNFGYILADSLDEALL